MTEHRHHWLIPEIPENSAYPSTCRDCGAERTFKPWIDEQKRLRQYNGVRTVVRKPREWEGERA